MMSWVERIVYEHLVEALQEYIDDPTLYRQFLLDGGLSEAEAVSAMLYFEGDPSAAPPWDQPRPPKPVMGYARSDGVFPCWAVVLGTEGNDSDYVGEDAAGLDEEGELTTDTLGNPVDVHIRPWAHRIDIITYADHPDIALYYYQLSKQILVSGRSAFQILDLDEITYSGRELMPDPRLLPSTMWMRSLSMSVKSDQEYNEKLRPGVGIGKKIAAYVSDGESLAAGLTDDQIAAIQSIVAKVTTYYEGDE
jgi:hypothetical protein